MRRGTLISIVIMLLSLLGAGTVSADTLVPGNYCASCHVAADPALAVRLSAHDEARLGAAGWQARGRRPRRLAPR
jgi:hypothetical protein